ncbi:hypothetical protein BLA60_17400 [Actinophytocola xinjiangensis]|uniref:Transketolase C-terminal domain-containing protein n=1 Tax=Actinophytocola xinjiangensis TaxID=485602 RepID=A0A7Z0WLJ0_9PSEU|nr:transketolase C-terminal domain-containing protein [Actinophytocola xinjiangensis]OLF10215.1 hypothetical protein BLA60_17400 [Actinophytocola xinjiangensis]
MTGTVVATSLMGHETERAADLLAAQGISVNVVDVCSIRPLGNKIICDSGGEIWSSRTRVERVTGSPPR